MVHEYTNGRSRSLGISVIMPSQFAGSGNEKNLPEAERPSLREGARVLVAGGLLFDGVQVGEDGEANDLWYAMGSHSLGKPHADVFPVLIGEGPEDGRYDGGRCAAWHGVTPWAIDATGRGSRGSQAAFRITGFDPQMMTTRTSPCRRKGIRFVGNKKPSELRVKAAWLFSSQPYSSTSAGESQQRITRREVRYG